MKEYLIASNLNCLCLLPDQRGKVLQHYKGAPKHRAGRGKVLKKSVRL